MRLILAGGNQAERLLRNRGKLRKMCSAWNARALRGKLSQFVSGRWEPELASGRSSYAISLTSWRKRLDVLPLTLLSLLRQDLRPEFIHVSLTSPDIEAMPAHLLKKFKRYGVIFSESPDYRSHKKWLPLLLAGRKCPFVVCDDDIIYPREWFRRLIREDRDDAYVGCKCHRIVLDGKGFPAPYGRWIKQIYSEPEPSHLLFTTGCGGEILHPRRVLSEFRDWERISTLCPASDDVWLKAAHLAANVPIYKTKYCFPCLELPGTDETGLARTNNAGEKDSQVISMQTEFGRIQKLKIIMSN